MVRPSMRGGVPVFRRPTGSFSSRRRAAKADAPADRPRGRPGSSASPTWICPSRNVPAVSTTASRLEAQADLRDDADDAVAFDHQVVDRLLEQRQVAAGFRGGGGSPPVEHAVGLRARRAHGRALARVEDAELDAGLVGRDGHRAAERVDLLDQVALADAADRALGS